MLARMQQTRRWPNRNLRTDHPIRLVVAQQGRSMTWLARELGISANYLHRLLLPDTHPDGRRPPDAFYERVSGILGVPESMLRPPQDGKAA
jgi:hypothetical protein